MKQKFTLCKKVILLVLYITEALLGVTAVGVFTENTKFQYNHPIQLRIFSVTGVH